MINKKHKMTVTIEIPYEVEVYDNVSDIDEVCRERVSKFFQKEFGYPLDLERMHVRIEEYDYVDKIINSIINCICIYERSIQWYWSIYHMCYIFITHILPRSRTIKKGKFQTTTHGRVFDQFKITM